MRGGPRARGKCLLAEMLERRRLLSVAVRAASDPLSADQLELELGKTLFAEPLPFEATPLSGPSSSPIGLTPPQIRGAYGFGQYGSSPIQFGASHVQGDGTGQTVAIIIPYDYPTALADLQAFDA